jgi:hypothetical protein
MFGRSKLRGLSAALAVATTAGFLTIAAEPASALATALPGSVLYDWNKNVWATDGVTTRQITTDGAIAASDSTGDTGYLVPTESDDGSVIVAVRNANRTSTDQQIYQRGYLWVMDAYGHVIRKINPPQYAYDGGTVCNLPANAPQGIANAQVSPDGKHIAYTIRELVEIYGVYGCYVGTAYRTTVIGIDGSSPTLLDDGSGSYTAAEDLEIGSWASNSTVLLDRMDFGSVQTFVDTVPNASAAAWFAPGSYTDAAYAQPDVRNGVLVTEGYSDSVMHDVLRLWSTTGYSASPTYRCELTSTVSTDDAIGDPSLSPDGSRVVYQDTDSNGSAAAAGQGIYLMSTSACSSPQLLVAGANDAFWSPASITPPPSVVIGSHPADPTRSTSASIAFTVSHSGATPSVTCQLDGGAATSCASPATYTGLGNGVHTFTVRASDGTRSSSDSVSWRVDTTAPVVSLTAPTALAIAGTSVPQNWSGSDTGSGIASYQAQYQTARYSGGFSAWANLGAPYAASVSKTTVSGLAAGYTYCLRVKATDKAGNAGYSAARCFDVALDDRSLSRSSGWSLGTGSAYYTGTITSTTKYGATLARSGSVTDRVGVVAKTGPGYGTVGLYVGSTLIGKISLAASTVHYRAVLLLPKFALRSGTVSVKVLTSGKPVAIDGLVVSHA